MELLFAAIVVACVFGFIAYRMNRSNSKPATGGEIGGGGGAGGHETEHQVER